MIRPFEARRTDSAMTETTEGEIPHALVFCADGRSFFAPVRVLWACRGRQQPERSANGRLRYALPGGGWID